MNHRFSRTRVKTFSVGIAVLLALILVAYGQDGTSTVASAGKPEKVALLVIYLSIALFFSFICSVFEAVLLSIRRPYVLSQKQQNPANAAAWEAMQADVNRPLSAILILNTVAHTVGAAGVGAQGVAVFGDENALYISAVLTVLILVLSEIIPKTIGAVYWKSLAPIVGKLLPILTKVMSPIVWVTEKLTSGLSHGQTTGAYSREEFTAIADIAHSEGSLELREMAILKNLLSLQSTKIEDVMTPRTVLFALPEATTTKEFVERYSERPFSRIPIYKDRVDEIDGFVLRSDILFSVIKNPDDNRPISTMVRDLKAVPETMPISKAFDVFLGERSHIAMVVDEFGAVAGIVTLEDIVETLLGLEIVDEVDRTEDMQALARRLWKTRAERMGIVVEDEQGADALGREPNHPGA
ncbi:MAG: HlyC/CorC family transporter [Verrucomicrobiae bacterium]|nr:HlyC/CorC family transporter [Verrucomicrobiae bacterium]